jgi:hypothetical protein
MKRRKFNQSTAAFLSGGLMLGPSIFNSSTSKNISPNAKLNIGVIGCNGMGWSNTRSMLNMEDVDLIGICDVDSNVVKEGVMIMRQCVRINLKRIRIIVNC